MADDQGSQDFGDMGHSDTPQQDQMYQLEMDDIFDFDGNLDTSDGFNFSGTPDQVSSSTSMVNDEFALNGNFSFSSTPNQVSASTPMANNQFNLNNFDLSGTPGQVSSSTSMANDPFNSNNDFNLSGTPNQTFSSIYMTNDQVDRSSKDGIHSHIPQQALQQAPTYQSNPNDNFDPSGAPDLDLDQNTSSSSSQDHTALSPGIPLTTYIHAPGPATHSLPTPQDSAINLQDLSHLRPEDLVPRSMPPVPPNTPSTPVTSPTQPDPQPRFTSFETARYQVIENGRIPAAIPDDDFKDVLSNINDWVMRAIDAVKLGGQTGAASNYVLQKFTSESGKIEVERRVWWLLEQTVRAHQYGFDPIISKAFDKAVGGLSIEEDMKCSERLEFVLMAVAIHYLLAEDVVKGETMIPTILRPKWTLGL